MFRLGASVLISVALGEAPASRIEWNVPCVPVSDAPQVTARVDVTPAQAGWQLDISFSAPVVGRRTLSAPTCEDAARAALLLLKVASAGGPIEAAAEPPTVQATPEPPPEPALPPKAATREARVWAYGAATSGTAPRVTPRFGVGIGVELTAALTLEAQLQAGVPAAFPGGPTTTSGFRLWPVAGASLALCGALRFDGFRLMACPVAQVEAVALEGLGVTTPRSAVVAWLALGADARSTIDLGERLFAHLAAGARVAVSRPAVTFEHFGTAYELPLLSGGGEVGLGWRW